MSVIQGRAWVGLSRDRLVDMHPLRQAAHLVQEPRLRVAPLITSDTADPVRKSGIGFETSSSSRQRFTGRGEGQVGSPSFALLGAMDGV